MAGDEQRISGKPNTGGQILHGLLWFVFVYSLWGIIFSLTNTRPNKSEYNLHGATAAICTTISLVGLVIVNPRKS